MVDLSSPEADPCDIKVNLAHVYWADYFLVPEMCLVLLVVEWLPVKVKKKGGVGIGSVSKLNAIETPESGTWYSVYIHAALLLQVPAVFLPPWMF